MSNRLERIINLKLNNFEIVPPKKGEDMIEPNPCQPGYEAIGLKEKDGRMVPNCVPVKEEQRKVKEGFPIPSPEGEDEDKYISRCISAIADEYPAEGQAYAVCKSKWDER
jgi:hypothetical protein